MRNQNTKNNKGITLIALIITIIVLLILAVVAIGAVQNDGIINHAKNARDQYGTAQKKENTTLGNYIEKLNENAENKGETVLAKGPWTQEKTIVTNGIATLQVGDYVDYKAEVEGYADQNGWRVLGAENGEILLISATTVNRFYIDNEDEKYEDIYDDREFLQVVVEDINAVCELYGKGKYASGARSVNVDDINRITGYEPETAKWNAGRISEYGNNVTYSFTRERVYDGSDDTEGHWEYTYKYSASNGLSGSYSEDDLDGEGGVSGGTFKSTAYKYETTIEEIGDLAYNTIFFKQSPESSNNPFLLASSYCYTLTSDVEYGLREAKDGSVDLHYLCSELNGRGEYSTGYVRAVVKIREDAKLKNNGANSWSLSE